MTELENNLIETVYKKYYTGERGECRYYLLEQLNPVLDKAIELMNSKA